MPRSLPSITPSALASFQTMPEIVRGLRGLEAEVDGVRMFVPAIVAAFWIPAVTASLSVPGPVKM